VRYTAILSNGGKLTVELPEGAGNELTIRDGRYLLDLTGIVLNTAHVAALVPLPDEPEEHPADTAPALVKRVPEDEISYSSVIFGSDESVELPVGLIDTEGDVWHRQDDGRYSIKPDGSGPHKTYEYITERYGIREIID
jgi:hypothetical protein